MSMKIKEVSCKSALTKSGMGGMKYSLNPYRGCEHGCIYCYAPFVLREKREWGEFVDVRMNIPFILSKELRRKEKGMVWIGSVTDAYQPLEKKYELTRKCLEQLLKHDFSISILTKSSLVLRDIDLIKQFSQGDVGITITTINDDLRKKYEPRSSSIEERLLTIKELKESGMHTWAFIGPIMPFITDRNLDDLINKLAKVNVDYVAVDRLRLKPGLWRNIEIFLTKHYPELIPGYKEIFWSKSDYFERVKGEIEKMCEKFGVRFSG